MKNRRKLVYIAAVAILATGIFFLFSGSGSSSDVKKNLSPESVVEEFTSAMKSGNFDKAEKLCVADSMNVYLDSYKQVWNALSQENEEAIAEVAKILAEVKLRINGVEELDGVCMVRYTLEMDGLLKKHQAALRMEGGEWKVVKITDKN